MPTPDLTNIGPIGSVGTPTMIGPPLPELEGPTGPTFEGAAPLQAGVVNVVSPDGEVKELDLDWLLKPENMKTFHDEGWSLPSKPSAAPEIPKSGMIDVISPSGELKELDAAWLSDPKNHATFQQEGWKLGTQPGSSIDQDLQDLTHAGWSKIDERHRDDQPQDKDGNYRLLDLNGDPVLANRKQLNSLLSVGFKFQDPNFQSLYEANRKLASDTETGADVFGSHAAESVPGVKWIMDKVTDNLGTNAGKASNIALDMASQKEQKTAAMLGTAAGIGAQLGIPTGVFGEVKLAQAAKAGLIGKLAPEGVGFLQTLGAKAAGGLVEGAIISAPQAIAQAAIDENPKAAAESLALGAGIGLIIGGGAPLLSKAGEFGLGGLQKGAEKLGGFLEKRNAGKLAELSGGSATQAVEQGLIQSATPLEMAANLTGEKAVQAEGLKKVDDLLSTSLAELKQSTGKLDDKFVGGLRQLLEGKRLESWLPKIDALIERETGAPAISRDFIKELEAGAAEQVALHPKLAFTVESLNEKLAALGDKAGYLGTSDLQKFIKQLGEEINWKGISSGDASKADGLKALYWGMVQEKLKSTISAVFGQAGEKALIQDPQLIAKWATEGELLNKYYNLWNPIINDPKSLYEINPLIQKGMEILSGKITGAAGGILGGFPGMLAGQALGDATKPITQGISTVLVDKFAGSDTKMGEFLVKNKLDQAIGSYLSLDAIKNMNTKIGEIPSYLQHIGGVLKVGAIKGGDAFIGSQDPVKTILGAEANGLSKPQQFQRLSSQLSKASSSPEVFDQNFNLHIAPLFKDHPELANQLYTDYQQKVKVLNDIVNAYNKQEPMAFQGKEKPYQPTTSQMKEMESLLKVAINPYALMEAVKSGRVTSKQVDVVNQLNPAILQQMRQKIVEEAYSGNAKLPYQQRMSLSVVMGTPMDPSLRNGSAMQAVYATAQPEQTKKTKSSGNSKSLKADKIAGYTASQRISKL